MRELIRATIVEDDELPPNTVTMGSKVEFREEGSKTNKVATLAHPRKGLRKHSTLGEKSGDGEETPREREVLRELVMRALDHE